MDNLFSGKNGYYWFFGTVESDADPLGLGRVRIRIAGWHNEDYTELKTDQLPWAYPITAINDWANSGKGKNINPPPPGTRVHGFFLDGEIGMQPVYTGVIPGMSIVENRRKSEDNSRNWLPNNTSLSSRIEKRREGDNPDTDFTDDTTVNIVRPDLRNENINDSEWVIPYSGFVSSPYGNRGERFHHGVDICPAGFYPQKDPGAPHLNGKLRGPTGLPVFSAADGEVYYMWKSDQGQGGRFSDYDFTGNLYNRTRSYGNAVVIKHVLSTGTYLTLYAHLGVSQDPKLDKPGTGIEVSIGQKVKKGERIGTVGRSHVWDSPTHLHFEIIKGTALPSNCIRIPPGLVFPQLELRDWEKYDWLSKQWNYNLGSLPYNKDDLNVKAKDSPKR